MQELQQWQHILQLNSILQQSDTWEFACEPGADGRGRWERSRASGGATSCTSVILGSNSVYS
eukprot:scaffold114883_cov22-Tisochrysis_lutea.AAC.1